MLLTPSICNLDLNVLHFQFPLVNASNVFFCRFREFHTLHDALEGDTKLRAAMKGVKGPNKWLNLPFSKLDSATIATRKQFLEKYLQVYLCES